MSRKDKFLDDSYLGIEGEGESRNRVTGNEFLLRMVKRYLFIYLFLVFLGLHPQRMEVPRLGVKWEL